MRIVVNKHCRVYHDFGRASSHSLKLYCTYQNHRLLHVHVAVMLYLFIRKIELPLLSIFETTIYALKMSCVYVYTVYARKLVHRVGKVII